MAGETNKFQVDVTYNGCTNATFKYTDGKSTGTMRTNRDDLTSLFFILRDSNDKKSFTQAVSEEVRMLTTVTDYPTSPEAVGEAIERILPATYSDSDGGEKITTQEKMEIADKVSKDHQPWYKFW